ncbi:unnamed protein product [Heterobilharzia americana]|nr:unnamed protein product [Heterobilharzia americana]
MIRFIQLPIKADFIVLLLISLVSSFQMPTIIYNLADETPAGSLIGNVAENLSPDYARKYTFLLISSVKFQYLSDFFKISPNGYLTTLRHIDRDNTMMYVVRWIVAPQLSVKLKQTSSLPNSGIQMENKLTIK